MLRLLVVSDIHGAARRVERLSEVRRDVTVVAGDIAECGSREEALEILDMLAAQGAPLVWVPGNCDSPSLVDEDRHYNVHGRSARVAGLVFAGAGGSLYTPFSTPFEYGEEELARILEKALSGVKPGEPLVLVVHTPPYGSGLDRVAGGSYVGSKALVSVLRQWRPLLLATGHIHEAWGVSAVAGVAAVNPGPFSRGHYALVEIDLGQKAVRVRTLKLR